MKLFTAIRDFATEFDAIMGHARTGRRSASPREATKTGRKTGRR